jgi:hypothetical protein
VILLHLVPRARPDDCYLGRTDGARIIVELVEHLKECIHAIGAGEDYPIIFVAFLHQFTKGHEVFGRNDLDGG